MRLVWLALAVAASGLPAAGPAHAAAPCVVREPVLAPPPAAPSRLVPPVRSDADGGTTVTLLVEDPPGGTYRYTSLLQDPDQNVRLMLFAHPWPGASRLVTYGLTIVRSGQRTRVPLFVTENAPSGELLDSLFAVAMREALPLALNGTPFATNTVAPTSTTLQFGLVLAPIVLIIVYAVAGGYPFVGTALGLVLENYDPRLPNMPMMYHNSFPQADGYTDRQPVYVWTTYRTAAGSQVWQGSVVTHNGTFRTYTESGRAVREGCRRTRIGAVARTGTATTYLGGVYLFDHAKGATTGPTAHRFDANQELTAGVSASGTDVPLTTVKQKEHKEGAVVYARQQSDEITLGVQAGDTFVPLVGTRADTTHTYRGGGVIEQHRLVSLGAYDPSGRYRPAAGVRSHFEKHPMDRYLLLWALGGGPGVRNLGDWEIDGGTFAGDTFVPLVGVTYRDDIRGGRDPHQAFVTAGVWTQDTYRPVVGATYDGRLPMIDWASMAYDGVCVPRWLMSAGTFGTDGSYVPVAGADYTSSCGRTVQEDVRTGVFDGPYPSFVPLVQARWTSDRPLIRWVDDAHLYGAIVEPGPPPEIERMPNFTAPSDGRLDVGVAGLTATFVPVTGVRFCRGENRIDAGAWAGDTFVGSGTCSIPAAAFTSGTMDLLVAGLARR